LNLFKTMQIQLTGSTGFLGKNLKLFFNSYNYQFIDTDKIMVQSNYNYIKNDTNTLINLVGIAHDTKDLTNNKLYYKVNTDFTKKAFDNFLNSNAKTFITISSVKAVTDYGDYIITEDTVPNPKTHYGKSKLQADDYILSKSIPLGKRFFILRPCMIHGPGNKGNLNLLFNIVNLGLPWPLGIYENKRSFCSIDNFCFIIKELIENEQIPSGVYNIADDQPLSTNELIFLISESQRKKIYILNIPKYIIKFVSRLGDLLRLPLNTERLKKLTESYVVSNDKILIAINKPLPLSAKDGLMKTLNSFNTK